MDVMVGSTSSRASSVKAGDVVEGRYRILSTLGEGGMGTVFLAEHALIKRRVAIKLLHADLATDDTVIDRFMNEARAAGTLGHPNIVESTDMGFTHDHVPYIVFEYLEGSLLTDEIYRVGGMPVRRAVRVAQQIASALHAAHNAGIVHRDLKSDNVFLTDKDDALDHVKVLDFGISRFMQADDNERGVVMGTPEFMAPEQITAPDNVDKRADIYALGVILYEMLAARRPFTAGEDPQQLMERIVSEAPAPLGRPEVPHALADMIMTRLLAKNPSDRYATMMDVEAALDAFTTQGEHPRRRSRPIAAVSETDVARYSSTIPRPVMGATTPYPGTRLDTMMGAVGLPPAPPARKPWMMYGFAALGLAVGAGGLVVGMRGGSSDQVSQAPAQPPAQPAMSTQQMTPPPVEPTKAAPAEKVAIVLDANVPGARVTFRRRVMTTPATMQVTPNDIVELVEVSAPGKQTVRYWLTFDRATTLNARLKDGKGSYEATEEDTLIALGEIAAPVEVAIAKPTPTPTPAPTPAPAAAAPAVAKQKPEQPASPVAAAAPVAPKAVTVAKETTKPAARKVGRSKDEPTSTEVAIAEPTPEVAKPSVPAMETGAKPTPAELPVATKPAPEPAPLPAPVKPTPVPAKPAVPTLDAKQVAGIFSSHKHDVVNCLQNVQGGGTVTLSLKVDASGKVTRAQVQTTMSGQAKAVGCIMKSANGWKFPARAGGSVEDVKYPFTIK